MRALAARTLALLSLTLVACGGQSTRPAVVDTTIDVHVYIEPKPDTLPFDPRSARLLAANRQLTALTGHSVEIYIDAALLASSRSEFERQLIAILESLITELVELRDSDKAAFTRTAAALRRIECRYRILAENSRATFEGGALRIEQPAHAALLAPPGVIRVAFDDREDDWLDAHFEHVEPETVAMTEAAAYLQWLTRTRPGYGSIWERRHRASRTPNAVEPGKPSPHAEVIERVVRLYDRLEPSQAALATQVRAWLYRQVAWLSNQYRTDRERRASGDQGRPMLPGERALCGWLARQLPHANADERIVAMDSFFEDALPGHFPGIDRLALLLAEADAWIAAGKPLEGGASSQSKLMDRVVCPSARQADGSRVRRSGCRSKWLEFALENEPNRRRLAAFLDTRDAELTEQLFAGMQHVPAPSMIALFRLLNPNRPAWAAAIRVFAEVLVDSSRTAVLNEAASLYRDQPSHRGDVLYILARDKRHDRTSSDYAFGKFQQQYGELIDRTALEGFLDHGSPAFLLLPAMWQALGKGSSRVQPIVSRLAVLLPDATQPDAKASIAVLSTVISRLCIERAHTELAELHSALDSRVTARPHERQALITLVQDSTPKGCVIPKNREAAQ